MHCPNMINCRSFIMLKLIDQPTSHILCTPSMKILLNIFMKSPTDLFPKDILYTICFWKSTTKLYCDYLFWILPLVGWILCNAHEKFVITYYEQEIRNRFSEYPTIWHIFPNLFLFQQSISPAWWMWKHFRGKQNGSHTFVQSS